MAKRPLTRTGTLRLGYGYQDLVTLDLLVEWLEHTGRYQWVRLEAEQSGSLDDLVALTAGGQLVVKQVKFSTDPESEEDPWSWEALLLRPESRSGRRTKSLIEKWSASLRRLSADQPSVDASVVSNRRAAPEVQNAISASGHVDIDKIFDPSVRSELINQLGGEDEARRFFSQFRFALSDPDLNELEAGIKRRFLRLGGTNEGWLNLQQEVRLWTCYKDGPPPEGRITLCDVRAAAFSSDSIEQLTHASVYNRACGQSDLWLQDTINSRRYIPGVYYPREEAEGELSNFLSGAKSGFLLLGSAGMGKTNLLCRKVEEWRKAGENVLFYAGLQLSAEQDLEVRFMRDLLLGGTLRELVEFLRRDDRLLIIVIDGANEPPGAADLIARLCALVGRYGRSQGPGQRATLKVVISARPAAFRRVLQLSTAGGGQESSLFPPAAFHTRLIEEEGRRVETCRFMLERVNLADLEILYDKYRAFEGYTNHGGRLVRFCPQTAFVNLSRGARDLLTHPWYLRAVMEIYDGKPIPHTLWTGDILRAVCAQKIYGETTEGWGRLPERARLVDKLVGLLRRHRVDSIRRDSLAEESPYWEQMLTADDVAHSPYLQLIDESVLMEVAEASPSGRGLRQHNMLRFTSDALFEYLLSEEILREEGLDIESIRLLKDERVIELLEESDGFLPLVGAVQFLLLEELANGAYGSFVRHAQSCGIKWCEIFSAALDQWSYALRSEDEERAFWHTLGLLPSAASPAGILTLRQLHDSYLQRSKYEYCYRIAKLLEESLTGDSEKLLRLRCQFDQARALTHMGESEEALQRLRQLKDDLAHMQLPPEALWLPAFCRAYSVFAEINAGNYQKVIEDAEDILKEANRPQTGAYDLAVTYSMVAPLLVTALRQQGEIQKAQEYADTFWQKDKVTGHDAVRNLMWAVHQAGLLADTGRHGESSDLLRSAIDLTSDQDVPPETLTKAYNRLGISLSQGERYNEARRAYESAAEIAEGVQLWASMGYALTDLALLEIRIATSAGSSLGNKSPEANAEYLSLLHSSMRRAEEYLTKALGCCQKVPNRRLEASIYQKLGWVATGLADVEKAEQYYREALRLYGEVQDDVKYSETYHSLVKLMNALLSGAQSRRDKETEANARRRLIYYYTYVEDWPSAVSIFEGWGHPEPLYPVAREQGDVLHSFGDFYENDLKESEKAARYFRMAAEVFGGGGLKGYELNSRLRLADVLHAAGSQGEASALLKQSIPEMLAITDPYARGRFLTHAGKLLCDMRDYRRARDILLEANHAAKESADGELMRLADDWLIVAETMEKVDHNTGL